MNEVTKVTGGCFCGAIRYESTEAPSGGGMCHCRMCQRWLGSAAAMGVWFDLATFEFTKGKPKTFMTSDILERSFCSECGTSLMHRYVVPPLGPTRVAIYIGTLDHPEDLEGPQQHHGVETHLTNWMVLDPAVPQRRAEDNERLAATWANVEQQGPKR